MKLGDKFSSFEEFRTQLEDHKRKTLTEYWMRDNRTFAAAKKRVPHIIDKAKVNLKYYYIKYCCIHGGQSLKTKEKKSNRKTSSFKQNCEAHIYLKLTEDGKFLQVKNISDEHNHPVNTEKSFKHLPQRRKLSSGAKREARNLLSLQANKRLVLSTLLKSTGQVVLLRDLSNLMRINNDVKKNESNLQECIKILQDTYGCEVDLLADAEKNFRGLFFQDDCMKQSFLNFPEILFLDGTYKLLNIRAPVYVFVVEDSCGGSEIVGLGILTMEDKESVDWLVRTFKKRNSACDKLRIIMTDKDENEREVIKKHFPSSKLLLCFFHTHQSFNREISCRKLGITPSEETLSKELIQKISYAKSVVEYDSIYERMKTELPIAVMDYYNTNWHPIRDEWVIGFTYQCGNFLNTTNNRVESLNNKIKSVVRKYSTLKDFIINIFIELTIQRNERDHKAVQLIHKVPVIHVKNNAYLQYAKLLTNFAYGLLENHLNSIEIVAKKMETLPGGNFIYRNIEEVVACSIHECECLFRKSMQLPCRHILAARNLIGVSLYEESLCLQRWHKNYYIRIHRLFVDGNESAVVESAKIEVVNVKKATSSHEKFRRTLVIAKEICGICAEQSNETYEYRYNQLKQLLDSWKNGNEVSITDIISNSNEVSAEFLDDTVIRTEDETSDTFDVQNENIIVDNNEVELNRELYYYETETSEVQTEIVTSGIQNKVIDNNEVELQFLNQEVSLTHEMFNSELHCYENESQISEVSELMIESKIVTKSSTNNQRETFTEETSVDELSEIKMPIAIRKRGRPKGLENTVIGIPKKKKVSRKAPFIKLNHREKEKLLLSWIMKDTNKIVNISSPNFIVHDYDIKEADLINNKVIEDTLVNFFYIRKYLTQEAWGILQCIIKRKKEQCNWICAVCANDINQNKMIRCEGCLNRYHLMCVSLKNIPKRKCWFCRFC